MPADDDIHTSWKGGLPGRSRACLTEADTTPQNSKGTVKSINHCKTMLTAKIWDVITSHISAVEHCFTMIYATCVLKLGWVCFCVFKGAINFGGTVTRKSSGVMTVMTVAVREYPAKINCLMQQILALDSADLSLVGLRPFDKIIRHGIFFTR